MRTISELVVQHSTKPGDIRVKRQQCLDDDWFCPYFVSQNGWWYGLDEEGIACTRPGLVADFELYTEPKPKVMRAQYLYLPHGGFHPVTSVRWFKDDHDFYSVVSHHGADIIMRLEEREFER